MNNERYFPAYILEESTQSGRLVFNYYEEQPDVQLSIFESTFHGLPLYATRHDMAHPDFGRLLLFGLELDYFAEPEPEDVDERDF